MIEGEDPVGNTNGIEKRLDILIAMFLQSRPTTDRSTKRSVGEEANFLYKFGLTYDEIARITGSTRDSVTELVGKARRAAKKSFKKSAAKVAK